MNTDKAAEKFEIWKPEKYKTILLSLDIDGFYALLGNEHKCNMDNLDILEVGPQLPVSVSTSWLESAAYKIEEMEIGEWEWEYL